MVKKTLDAHLCQHCQLQSIKPTRTMKGKPGRDAELNQLCTIMIPHKGLDYITRVIPNKGLSVHNKSDFRRTLCVPQSDAKMAPEFH